MIEFNKTIKKKTGKSDKLEIDVRIIEITFRQVWEANIREL